MRFEVETTTFPKDQFFGFHSSAITFESDQITGDLTHNFGLGGASLFLTVEIEGTTFRETLDLRIVLKTWVTALAESKEATGAD